MEYGDITCRCWGRRSVCCPLSLLLCVGITMIFFDIDDTLLDNQKAELAAAKEFQLLYKDIFSVSSDEFALNWRSATEKHVRRYLSGELSFQGQRRERLRELFSHNRVLPDDEADYIFQEYLTCLKRLNRNEKVSIQDVKTMKSLLELKDIIGAHNEYIQRAQGVRR